MYEEYYRLREKPFQIVPNPGILYLSKKHKAALTYLKYGITEGAGVIMLTGEVGTGKTTLVRYILNSLCRDEPTCVIFDTNMTPDELLSAILDGFGVNAQGKSKPEKIEILYKYLVKCFANRENPLLIIDEAQNLPIQTLEEVRMLSNLQSDNELLLQILLVGQPELKKKLGSYELLQFAQRIAVKYHISAFNKEETVEYINFRTKKAGRTTPLFTPEAIGRVFDASGGIPRTINLICDLALVYSYGLEEDPVSVEAVEKVIGENFSTSLQYAGNKLPDSALETLLPGKPLNQAVEERLQRLEGSVYTLLLKFDTFIRKMDENKPKATNVVDKKLSKQLDIEKQKCVYVVNRYNWLVKKYKELELRTTQSGLKN